MTNYSTDHAIVETPNGKFHASVANWSETLQTTITVRTLCGQRGYVVTTGKLGFVESNVVVAVVKSGVNAFGRIGREIECGNCNRIAEKDA